jgi:SmpA / OmlA family
MSMENFARRYVVAEDPTLKISSYPLKVQDAIHQAKVMIGMNREQVLMALGYPVSSENPNLADKTWNYWLFTWLSFKVRFDDGGRVVGVDADRQTKDRILAD